MATLSTTAWVVHDLGLAAGFGGNLFGQLALNPAVRSLESKRERGKITHVAWDRYRAVNAASLGAMAGSWLIGRAFASGREVGSGARAIVIVKDILVGAAVATGVASMIVGTILDKQGHAFGMETGAEPTREVPPRIARLQRATTILGVASLALQAAVMATTTVLAMKGGKSSRWGIFSRLLP